MDLNLYAKLKEAGVETGVVMRNPLVSFTRAMAIILPGVLVIHFVHQVYYRVHETVKERWGDKSKIGGDSGTPVFTVPGCYMLSNISILLSHFSLYSLAKKILQGS